MDIPEDYIEKLVLAGIVEVAALDPETNEFLYSFNPNLEETNPELFAAVSNSYGLAILDLWTQGYLDVDLDKNNEQIVLLNDKSLNEEELDKLNPQERALMNAILRSFEIDS